ncbi:hypothetical protein C5Z25_07890 [Lactobacillus sp. CBA3605]|uniref:hypothetical protein n=1 Tax=Lactobacillus sp. CBA3605 TaxID=2099788 RepID=UPI000CFC45D4|nr:hypothetical protein [Lactobacillus sp. CBA3605]AVK61700.1 hypothetical protein C5Z25_07890 [Lactobacillus sp. CBA3605]
MKNTFKKLTITLMAAGTLFATTATAMADTTPTTTAQTTTTLTKKVNHETNLAMPATKHPIAPDLTPKATKLVNKTIQNQVLATIDASSQSLDKLKYQPAAD